MTWVNSVVVHDKDAIKYIIKELGLPISDINDVECISITSIGTVTSEVRVKYHDGREEVYEYDDLYGDDFYS